MSANGRRHNVSMLGLGSSTSGDSQKKLRREFPMNPFHSDRGIWPPALLPTLILALAATLICASSAGASYYLDSQFGSLGSTEGQFSGPNGAGSTFGGDTYIAETGNNRVQQFDSGGTFVRAWGWGVADGTNAFQVCTSGCQAGIAGGGDGQFSAPQGVAIAPNGDVYVGDDGNARILRFDSSGNFVAAMGWGVSNGASVYQVCSSTCQAGIAGPDGGQFDEVLGLAVDPSGNVYAVDDSDNRIQKFDSSGNFVAAWGYGVSDGTNAFQVCTSGCQAGIAGSGDGQFNAPDRVTTDSSGNVYVTDAALDRVQKFDSSGSFLTKWGTTGAGAGQFAGPRGIATDAADNVYVADASNDRVEKFDSSGNFILTWGYGVATGANAFQVCTSGCQTGITGSGSGQFDDPQALSIDGSGAVYVTNAGTDRVEKFRTRFMSAAGIVGSGKGSLDGQFKNARGITIDPSRNILVADTSNNRVQKFNPNGTFLTKWGAKGTLEGQFKNPYGVEADATGNIYVADTSNNRIQKFDSSGNFQRMWGWGVDDGTNVFQTCTSGCQKGASGSGDGQFKNPRAVAVDPAGNVYVADTSNNRIQKFDPSGNFLGKWGVKGTLDGQLKNPYGVVADRYGNVYVSDTSNGRVQKFDTSGTFLLKWGAKGKLDGQFTNPRGITVDPQGAVHVVDSSNGRVQVFEPLGAFEYIVGAKGSGPGQLKNPYDVAVDPNGYLLVMDTSNNRVQRFF
jgi:streptogramin lyase